MRQIGEANLEAEVILITDWSAAPAADGKAAGRFPPSTPPHPLRLKVLRRSVEPTGASPTAKPLGAKVSNPILDRAVTELCLDSAEVGGCLVDSECLRAAGRVSAIHRVQPRVCSRLPVIHSAGQYCGFDAVADAEFYEDAAQMVFYRRDADAQPFRRFLVVAAIGDGAEDGAFMRRKR